MFAHADGSYDDSEKELVRTAAEILGIGGEKLSEIEAVAKETYELKEKTDRILESF